jgi:hypothetical protein
MSSARRRLEEKDGDFLTVEGSGGANLHPAPNQASPQRVASRREEPCLRSRRHGARGSAQARGRGAGREERRKGRGSAGAQAIGEQEPGAGREVTKRPVRGESGDRVGLQTKKQRVRLGFFFF